MVIKCYNEEHQYILFFDIEFNNRELIQFAGILFKKIDDNGGYQLMRSVNTYVTSQVCYPFMEYTHITNNFLKENGVPLDDARAEIMDDFLKDIPLDKTLIVSHGLKNDRNILSENGFNFNKADNKPIDGYCTFSNAKRILNRQKRLTLNDIATEAGFYMAQCHNAFNDVLAEICVFTYLKKIEEQQKESAEL